MNKKSMLTILIYAVTAASCVHKTVNNKKPSATELVQQPNSTESCPLAKGLTISKKAEDQAQVNGIPDEYFKGGSLNGFNCTHNLVREKDSLELMTVSFYAYIDSFSTSGPFQNLRINGTIGCYYKINDSCSFTLQRKDSENKTYDLGKMWSSTAAGEDNVGKYSTVRCDISINGNDACSWTRK